MIVILKVTDIFLKLFLIHVRFNDIIFLILFLKYFYHNNHKTIISNCGFKNIIKTIDSGFTIFFKTTVTNCGFTIFFKATIIH